MARATIPNGIDMDFNKYPNYMLIILRNFLNFYFVLSVLIFQNISQSFHCQFQTFHGNYLPHYLPNKLHVLIFQTSFKPFSLVQPKESGRPNLWPMRAYKNLCILILPQVFIPMTTHCKNKCLFFPLFFS